LTVLDLTSLIFSVKESDKKIILVHVKLVIL
jgi:hypothetical protein